jgi:polar amino acid transport system permease protein
MSGVWEWFAWLNQAHGINLPVFYDSYDRQRFFAGLLTTLELSALSVVASVVIGLIGAWLLGTSSIIARRLVHGYVHAFRNTPPLIQLSFLYFAVGNLLPRLEGVGGSSRPLLDGFAWAVITLSLFGGSFNVEIFRSGIEAVPESTVEAAEALGFDRWRLYRHVVLPLALRICLPALSNNLVNLVKTSTLAYAIGVPELLYVSAQVWSDTMNVREMMNLLLVAYVGIVGVLSFGLRRLEMALRVPGLGTVGGRL